MQPWLAAERYEVGAVVGRGGYGMVCRGLDRKTGLPVALKMLSPEAGRDPDLVERMLREQQALVALSGTCAVTAIDLCRLESGAPCLVMEWLDGHDLEQQLTRWEEAKQTGSNALLLQTLKPLTETLERAHLMGIVHRDIKPANIFLARNAAGGTDARLLDFGLSRMKSAAPLTGVGIVMGSPSYIAPETWRGNSATLDGRADLFALAVIVFRWLTGSLPFDAGDLIAKMTAVTSGPRPSAVALRPDLPTAVDAWLSRALAVEPADRFQTGSDFYAALEAALRGELWSNGSADISGIREVTTPAAAQQKSVLATAWGKAASLLKRFTNPRDSVFPEVAPAPAPAPAPIPAPIPAPTLAPASAAPLPAASEAVEDAPVSERKSIWLDSTELEELVSEPHHEPVPAPAPQPQAKSKRQTRAKTKAKAAKAKAKGRAKAKLRADGKPHPTPKARSRKRKA
jgi:eukaryotic-like serine/threonine-protein kinase